MTSREVAEGPQRQGADEKIVYSVTTTPWGSAPSDAVVVVKDTTDGGSTDVSGSVLAGSVSVNGDVITLPKIQSLTAGHTYRVEIQFVAGNNTFEAYFIIRAEE